MLPQQSFNFPQFDPEATKFDLIVQPTEAFQLPINSPPDHVAGPV